MVSALLTQKFKNLREALDIIRGLNDDSFIQHVANNVEHNIRAIDGLNTFH